MEGIMKNIIVEKDNLNNKCTECGAILEYNDEWDDMFDRYDQTTPNFDMVTNRLYQDGIPKYKCTKCKVAFLVAHR